ncbi:MAG: polymer-forming cytoskeletal protein [Treponema sp.]|jgi:cytoskeletal protein CcmA (bactofilin family)|nr:polymer-forming cytoskeletal protein [Treponema sp.]
MPASKREDFSVNTIIGPNTCINGDVNSAGFTRVDGSLRGDLNAAGRIIVGERARMKSNITGTAVTIGGVVSGNVLANERVVILATGIVLGDIITQRIQADEGCLLHGRITVCQTRETWNNAVNEYRDREDIKSATAGFALRPNPAVSGVSAGELSPENGIQAAEAAFPETVPPAAEPETINPAPVAAGDQAPESEYAALPQETPSAGEQAVPEYPDAENTAPETAPVSAAEWTGFPENMPNPPEEAVPPDTAVPAEDTLAKTTTLPGASSSGADGPGENHGES